MAVHQPVKLLFTWRTRFYSAVLDRDLFGQWSVTRSWGSSRNGQGGGRITVVPDFDSGLALLRSITGRREKLGYRLSQ
ncbi:MAG TPA: WGR domain-containing protein [Noviherbaspirillum sp.]